MPWLTAIAWPFIRNTLGKLPWQVWAAIISALFCLGAWTWHKHEVSAAYTAGRHFEADRWQKSFDAMNTAAAQWRRNYEAKASVLSQQERKAHEAELARIHASADALRMRGPGMSEYRCEHGSPASVPVATSGHDAPSGTGDGAVAVVPTGERLAVVPWDDLTGFAEQCDANRAEVIAWRRWDTEQAKAYGKAVAALKAQAGK